MKIEVRFPSNIFHPTNNNDKYYNACKIITEMESAKVQDEGVHGFLFEYHLDIPKVRLADNDSRNETILKLQSTVNKRLMQIQESDINKYLTPQSGTILYDLIKDIPQTNKLREDIKLRKKEREQILSNRPSDIQYVYDKTDSNKLLFLLMAVTNNQIHPETAQNVLDLLEKE